MQSTIPLKDLLAKKRVEWKSKLDNFSIDKEEVRRINRQCVLDEKRKLEMPKNWESKKRRLQWEMEREKYVEDCEEIGLKAEEELLLDRQADTAAQLDAKERRRKPIALEETGYDGFEARSYRTFLRGVNQIQPNMKEYNKEKRALGDLFYPTVDTLGLAQRKDSKEGVERLVKDLETQKERRARYHRRRRHNDNACVDYINEKNKRFNESIERAYGTQTAEIKQNLERGTAL